jgi:hypothetical protein
VRGVRPQPYKKVTDHELKRTFAAADSRYQTLEKLIFFHRVPAARLVTSCAIPSKNRHVGSTFASPSKSWGCCR